MLTPRVTVLWSSVNVQRIDNSTNYGVAWISIRFLARAPLCTRTWSTLGIMCTYSCTSYIFILRERWCAHVYVRAGKDLWKKFRRCLDDHFPAGIADWVFPGSSSNSFSYTFWHMLRCGCGGAFLGGVITFAWTCRRHECYVTLLLVQKEN